MRCLFFLNSNPTAPKYISDPKASAWVCPGSVLEEFAVTRYRQVSGVGFQPALASGS
jgi:hypothetical protein